MIVVMVSTIVAMVSALFAMIGMLTIYIMTSASPTSAVSPASRENTPGGGEQDNNTH